MKHVVLRCYYQPSGDRWEVEYKRDKDDFINVMTFTGPNAEFNARTLAQSLRVE
jgi:hypothetical protein